MNWDEARQAALDDLNKKLKPETYNDEIIILDEYSFELDNGWRFYFKGKRHHLSGDINYSWTSNIIFVRKNDGAIVYPELGADLTQI